MLRVEKLVYGLSAFGRVLIEKGPESKILNAKIVKNTIAASLAFAGVMSAVGCEDSYTYAVNQCPDKTKPPLTFEINCTDVNDPSEKCKTYLDNTACGVYPAFQQITQLSLTNRCSSLWYGIYPQDKWRFNVAGFSAAPSCKIFWIDSHSILNDEKGGSPYDAHEILHQLQFELTIINSFNHSLFVTTTIEAQRLIDPAGHPSAISSLQLYYADSLAHPEKILNCTNAQRVIEEGLYLKDNRSIYEIYSYLQRSNIRTPEIALSSAMYAVSGNDDQIRQYLLDHGCIKFY